ncbi:MAG: 4Fe-4S dicluster domain-containing protein [Clostridiales bacterium]|nr:4Fe-4S dicluster domain-containing protein [Clostridiales bacterium]
MERIKKNFGFGCMRPPMKDGEVDIEEFSRMVDAFLDAGFNYFDTAHPYVNMKSEPVLRECLTSRYPRESYVLTNKLSGTYFEREEDIRPLFERQLAACGVDYFDFYLMHAQSAKRFEQFKRCRAYETALALKEEGRARHVGLSFHDTADVLDQILTEYPQMEVVQLQLNYLDWDDPSVQARKCWEVCRKHGKPVIVMEPCKGGKLAQLPEEARGALDALGGGSPASYAIRFAAGHEGVMMVLSGMSNMAQMEDNIAFMKDFRPLDGRELAAVEQVREALLRGELIPCTACRYCVDGCPMKIAIPELFACLNDKKSGRNQNAGREYENVHTVNNGRASACVKCGKCEEACPQRLPIRELLVRVAKEFERG